MMSPNSFVVLSSGDEGAEYGDSASANDYASAQKLLFDHIINDINVDDTKDLLPWPTTVNLARSLTMSVLNGMAAGLVKMARSSVIRSSRIDNHLVDDDKQEPRFIRRLEKGFDRLTRKCKALFNGAHKWVGGLESRQL